MTKAQRVKRMKLDEAIQTALSSAEVFFTHDGCGYGHIYIRFLEKTEYGLRLYANRLLVLDLRKCEAGKRTLLEDYDIPSAPAAPQTAQEAGK